jgi:hypothetical protein
MHYAANFTNLTIEYLGKLEYCIYIMVLIRGLEVIN